LFNFLNNELKSVLTYY